MVRDLTDLLLGGGNGSLYKNTLEIYYKPIEHGVISDGESGKAFDI